MRNPSPALIPELLCTSIKNSLRFYTGVLGFNVLYERPEKGFAMLERQGAQLMLEEFVSGSARNWTAGPIEPPFGRGINLQIETTAVEALYAAVKETGAKVFLALEEKWYRAQDVYLGNRQFIVQDPDGYLLRFFEDLGERGSEP